MAATQLVGAFLALLSALIYGSADFFGGLASRRQHPYAVLVLTSIIGTFCMAGLALIFGESWPAREGIFWGSVAGICGLLGLVLLYYGLAQGNATVVSPISGVVSACMPVLYFAIQDSLPSPAQLAGFIIAVPGIILVTQVRPRELPTINSASMPITPARKLLSDGWVGSLAGVFFGFFFISLSQITQGAVFGPLAVSKFIAFVVGLGLTIFSRVKINGFKGNLPILWAGLLDPIANALYLIATRYTRMDVAAVLSSLYPAGTVCLSFLILKERINRLQWIGVAFCLLSIMLITSP